MVNEQLSQVEAKRLHELSFWIKLWHDLGDDVFSNPNRFPEWTCRRYCEQLGIERSAFRDQTVVDIGCGPVGSLHHFQAQTKIGVDPNARYYQPLGINQQDMLYLSHPAEDIPLPDESVDVVISVNALDHVDDFEATMAEIQRILKVGGRFLASLNLQHHATKCEPQVLDKARIGRALAGKFDYAFVKTIRTDEELQLDSVIVDGSRLPGVDSPAAATTQELMAWMTPEFWQRPGAAIELDKAQRFGGATHTELADWHVQNAFLAWQANDRKDVVRHVFSALTRDPRWLRNRGVVSILARSLVVRKTSNGAGPA